MISESNIKTLNKLIEHAKENNKINPTYYDLYDIKRGLRNNNGTGVLVGLTEVGSVHGYVIEDDKKIPREGKLFYRGIEINEIVNGFQEDKRYGFEETIYLLLFGKLPNKKELDDFNKLLGSMRNLPSGFNENFILKLPSKDVMNLLQRTILFLYSLDDNPDDISINNIVKQSLYLIARFPTIIAYGYQAKVYNYDNKSLFIHPAREDYSTAENILHMSRADSKFTRIEAEVLDLSLVMHAEHGGGNNSAFATHVVSSSGTDTYSAIATAVGSLKGPKHGGANIKVRNMIDNIKENVKNYSNKEELKKYLKQILNKEVFDKQGLIYGMGHAIYTISDPRAMLLKEKARELAIDKNAVKEFELYENIELLTKEIFLEQKNKLICANVDLYSGFVYSMLNIPQELYTPLFATARIASWCAHRIEQILSDKKIIRPAYKNVSSINKYVKLKDR
ncbi:citrate synthase [Hypnocyclicus thermotrophus]|uniref:Citrate synthase n=1 Tax=Hypnocyclicus thermotrophus TaxID=1627895 RepID=A0AA46E0H5_9FUSO|nr:citrate/2-methylcitrate synthase [Hypnocyclicus thermotrophus]TDT72524.1 citrate synthase [Hypnocyclicus thermotrophus]